MEEIWNNFNVPAKLKKVKVLENFVEKHDKRVLTDTIKKLHDLLNDPLTQTHISWINKLFDEFFRINQCKGFKVRELPLIVQILEFLGWKVREIPEYQIHLNKMLRMCRYSPYLEKTSDIIIAPAILEQYYTNLGYLMIILPTNEQLFIILDSLHELLSKSKFSDTTAIKMEYLHKAIKNTCLPIIMVKLYNVCCEEMQKHVLQIIYTLSRTSHIYSHKMLEYGIMNSLLLRLEKLYMDILLNEHIEKEVMLIIKILWLLVDSKHLSAPSNEAMRSLTNVFKCTIDGGISSEGNLLRHRNDLAMIILTGIMFSPPWNIINCGLAAEIIIALSKFLKLPMNQNDLVFTRTVLAILCHLSDSCFCIFIMKKEGILEAIFQFLSINNKTDNSTYWIPYILRTLSLLVPKMTEEFIKLQGFSKLLTLLQSNMTINLNLFIINESIRNISLIISEENPALIADLQNRSIINLFSKLNNRILMLNPLTMTNQRILMLSLLIIEKINQSNISSTSNNELDEYRTILLKFFLRCLNDKEEDFIYDERLIICTAHCSWKYIISCSMALNEFIDLGGIYLILDNLSHCPISLKSILLGILSDLCRNSHCVLHICTWRDPHKSKGFFNLLAELWREEEEKLQAKRTENGCIDDIELPLMGKEQWKNSFHRKIIENYSPTLESWLESIRSKIYSIRKQLLMKSHTFERAKERYKIQIDDYLSHQDAITFCIIDQFFRFTQGQMWAEVLRYLKQRGTNPLGTDGEMLLIMCQRHRECGLYVKASQETILKEQKRIEMRKEAEDISKIRDARLTSALQTVKTIDLIRKTADNIYRIQKKNEQAAQVNQSSRFPINSNSEHCHSTYSDKLNVTMIFNQRYKMNNSHTILDGTSFPNSTTTVLHDFFQDIDNNY